jgi:hypothetical protein
MLFVKNFIRNEYIEYKLRVGILRDSVMRFFASEAPENHIRVISNFFENSQVKMHNRYQRHRWQIIGTECSHLKVKLPKKFIYMLTLLPKDVQAKY